MIKERERIKVEKMGLWCHKTKDMGSQVGKSTNLDLFQDPLSEHLDEDLSSALREIFLKSLEGCLTRWQLQASIS